MQCAYLFEKEKDGFHGFDGDMNILFFLLLLTTVSIIYNMYYNNSDSTYSSKDKQNV